MYLESSRTTKYWLLRKVKRKMWSHELVYLGRLNLNAQLTARLSFALESKIDWVSVTDPLIMAQSWGSQTADRKTILFEYNKTNKLWTIWAVLNLSFRKFVVKFSALFLYLSGITALLITYGKFMQECHINTGVSKETLQFWYLFCELTLPFDWGVLL